MSKIKLLVMDVDGTLTDGKIYIGSNGELMKAFDVKDGYGIAQILPKLNIAPAIITGRESKIVANRAGELGIVNVYQSVSDKICKLKELAANMSISAEEIAYIGDDLNDLDCIEYCGLTACPADAVADVMQKVDYICCTNGGLGAVREFIEYIADMDGR